MPVRPTSHFTWQVLRTAKRSKKALNGRALRLVPTRNTKDGTFLTALVADGLLERATGSEADPFEATYTLTEKGKFAAEYGEYEFDLKRPEPGAAQSTPTRGRTR
ncbi:hypothetical protein J8F10_05490 [Gemmata sp. G18]|uniref:Uncharacterized protein n=1 Tax=Gemmata palustris TaxID=2822762 RepID=A0ABS5BM12_9BACT|nr:hypothetical protein [Gemmata palustris]MBP3954737.1 hypothetical protein [Gemmata palustris]